MKKIYKILTRTQWAQLQDTGLFSGSEHDLKDGFIHLSLATQVPRILAKYYKNEESVFIAEFASKDYEKNLKWEIASNGEEFPHVYNVSLYKEDMLSFRERKLS